MPTFLKQYIKCFQGGLIASLVAVENQDLVTGMIFSSAGLEMAALQVKVGAYVSAFTLCGNVNSEYMSFGQNVQPKHVLLRHTYVWAKWSEIGQCPAVISSSVLGVRLSYCEEMLSAAEV